jgi:hypothetical protein
MPYRTEAFEIFLAMVIGVFYLCAIILRKNNAVAGIPAGVLVFRMFLILSVLFMLIIYFKALDNK